MLGYFEVLFERPFCHNADIIIKEKTFSVNLNDVTTFIYFGFTLFKKTAIKCFVPIMLTNFFIRNFCPEETVS
jgi:hypothetical protein